MRRIDAELCTRGEENLDPFRPWQAAVYQGYTMLLCQPNGSLHKGRDGLFDFDARILSHYQLTLADGELRCASSGPSESNRWSAQLYVARPGGDATGPALPQDTLEVILERRLGPGMEERLTVHNYSVVAAQTELAVELDADFADIMEVTGAHRPRGTVERAWDAAAQCLRFAFHAEHGEHRVERGLEVRVVRAEPGKMIHEMRRGPLSELNLLPQRAYYGSHTTAAMFVLALSELWHWTGDIQSLRRYRDAALRTFEWVERFGDRDGDGFLEYERRSARGLKNQGWKDSDEAIRYPNGSLVPNPIATVEEQAFHFIALLRMAEILIVLEEDALAAGFIAKARQLRQRWDRAFWMEDAAFYAMALDPEKQPVRSIGSNPGHALGVGLVPSA